MFWQDEGVVLSVRRHGESAAIVSLMSPAHGRHAGLVRGGVSRRARPLFQPGNRLLVTWRARLAEHLGQFTAEPADLVAGRLMDQPDRLAALASACALLDETLPERDPHAMLYQELLNVIRALCEEEGWAERYVAFELGLLAELGFGLDLSACAVTGETAGLAYVSPASGRAVTAAGAGRWASRLLPLPGFLIGQGPAGPDQVLAALQLTGAFLRRHLFDATDRAMPPARERLIARLTPRSRAAPP